jgi:hypothetical protein
MAISACCVRNTASKRRIQKKRIIEKGQRQRDLRSKGNSSFAKKAQKEKKGYLFISGKQPVKLSVRSGSNNDQLLGSTSSNDAQKRATTSNDDQAKATTSNDDQAKVTTSNDDQPQAATSESTVGDTWIRPSLSVYDLAVSPPLQPSVMPSRLRPHDQK